MAMEMIQSTQVCYKKFTLFNLLQGTTDLVLALLVIQYVAAQEGLAEGIESPKLHIIGGQDADEGEYPFMVGDFAQLKN